MCVVLRLSRAWWHEGVDYHWVVGAVASRSALGVVKFAIGLCGLATPLIGMLIALSPTGPHSAPGRTLLWILVATGVLWGLRWLLLPWPGETESLALIAIADVCVTLVCTLSTGYVVRAVAMTLLLIVGVYISAFHSPKILAAHTLWSLTAAVLLAAPLFDTGDPASALIMILGMLAAALVPLGLQFCYWVMRSDMLSDPLTGLLSRRGLDYHSAVLLARPTPIPVCAIIVDLDRFKSINDTHGHHTGDEVLIRTATRLRDTAPPGSIVSRIGGEEFAIIARLPPSTATDTAEHLRRAITAPINGITITASIGLALTNPVPTENNPHLISTLIRSADTAMYTAKQSGGNAVHFHSATIEDKTPTRPR